MTHVLRLRAIILMGMVCAALGGPRAWAENGQDPIAPEASVEGQVHAIAVSGTTAYLAGNIDYIGYHAPNLASLSSTTGIPSAAFPWANGGITAMISDGANGYWVAGNFSLLGSAGAPAVAVTQIAHVLSTNAVVAVPITFNSSISCLALHNNVVYVGGNFNLVGGYTLSGAAAFIAGGPNYGQLLTAWNPNCNGAVTTIDVVNNLVWLTGSFTTVGGLHRNCIAAVDPASGAPALENVQFGSQPTNHVVQGTNIFYSFNGSGVNTGFDKHGLGSFSANGTQPLDTFPEVVGLVEACITDGGTGWYVGGTFSSIGGVARPNLAHVRQDGSIDTTFNASPDAQVNALLLSGGTLYVGGNFTHVNGTLRSYLAGLNPATGALVAWDPEANGLVNCLLSANGLIWAGGTFTAIGGEIRYDLAGCDPVSGVASSWNLSPNTQVTALASLGSTLFVGGFHYGGSVTGYNASNLAALTSLGAVDATFPATNGTVSAIISDGTGGWFVGGSFSQIGKQAIPNLAHVTASYTVDSSFQAAPNGAVTALCLNGSLLYVGGSFTTIGQAARGGMAAVSATTGIATGWSPNANGQVNAIAIASDGSVYVGGTFTVIGGQNRSYLAQLDPVSALANAGWNPGPNAQVRSLLVIGTRIFIGGDFTVFAGVSGVPTYLCSFSTGNSLDNWNPLCNGTVYSLIADGALKVRVGGSFTTLNGASHQYAADVPIATGVSVVPTSWNPQPNTTVVCMADLGSSIALGGNFTTINNGATARTYFAEVDTVNGTVVAGVDPALNNSVNALAVSGSAGTTLALGGLFKYSHAVFFNGLSAYDLGATTPVPGFDAGTITGNNIYALTVSSDARLYAGGDFNQIGTGAHTGVAELSPTTGTATGFDPQLNGAVDCLAVSGSTLLLGGPNPGFTSVHGSPRAYAAAVDRTSGLPSAFAPNPDNSVFAITPSLDAATFVIGGNFTFLGYQARPSVCQIDATSGLITPWTTTINSTTNAMAVDGSELYITGNFNQVGGQSRAGLAALDTTTAAVSAWAPALDSAGDAIGVLPGGGPVYVSGGFAHIAGLPRNQLGAISEAGVGTVTGWDPSCKSGSGITTIIPQASSITLSGSMDYFGGGPRSSLAAIDVTTGAPLPWAPLASGSNTVQALAVLGGTVYAGGSFVSMNGINRGNLAAIDGTTGITVAGWQAPTSGTVESLAVVGSTLYVGGLFTSINGQARAHLGAVDGTTGSNTSFDPECDSDVLTLAVSGTTLYAGGNFLTINTTTTPLGRAHLAAFDTGAGTAIGWNPSANAVVDSLVVQGGLIYAGGAFTAITGQAQTYLAAIDATGALQTAWQPTVNSYVYAEVFGNTDLVIGGAFTQVDGLSVNPYLTSVNPTTNTAFGSWPTLNNVVYALARSGQTLIVGGQFAAGTGKLLGGSLLESGVMLVPLAPTPNPGDLNNDHVVNNLDLDLVLSHFGFRITDVGWDPLADANGDGVVNVVDLNLVISNFNKTYP